MLGRFRSLSGKGGTFDATSVPVEVLQNMKMNPVPITISGASNVTFTLAGSVTRPAVIWTGDDFISLRTTKAYTFLAGANNTILASTGVVTASQSPATGCWYFYVGYDSDGDLQLYPSQTAPSYVQVSKFNASVLGHPGTSRTANWSYVGFIICNATTPTFLAATKLGYTYHMAATASYTKQATTSTYGEIALALPKHAAAGLMVAGTLETGAAGSVTVGPTSGATVGIQKAYIATASGAAFVPFGPISPNANGKLYAVDVTTRGDVHVTEIIDVI